MRPFCLLAVWLTLLVSAAYAQDETTSTPADAGALAPQEADEKPEDIKVEVTVTRSDMDDFTSQADVTVWIHSNVPINLQSITLALPSPYVYDGRNATTPVDLNNLYEVDPGRRREYHASLEPIPWYFGIVPMSFRKKLDAKIVAVYKLPDDPGEQTATGAVDLPVAGPFSGVLVGAVIGVTTIYVIMFARRRRSWKDYAVGLIGTVVVIALARFTTTDVIALPVAIELRDSAAGFLIGLLCQSIEDPLVKRFFPKLATR
jgi:hypothetical protein